MRNSATDGSGDSDAGLRLRMRGEERRITSQHARLDELCGEVHARLDEDGAVKAVGEFALFAAALDAHMTVEEDIYFPALHGLRPDSGEELTGFVRDHAQLREALGAIRERLEANDGDRARESLDRLAQDISRHELAEEALIARITEGPVGGLGRAGLGS
jgi:hypothetical protein